MAKLETRAKGQFGSINSMHRFDAVSDDEDADDSNYNVGGGGGSDNNDDGDEDDTNNKTIGDEGITVDFRFIKVHTSN